MTKDLFGSNIIYAYTRADALADGEQIDATQTAREAGIAYPVFLTRAVFDSYVTVPPGVIGQDESGRLWDILWMLRNEIKSQVQTPNALTYSLFVRNDNRTPRLVNLLAVCGPVDIDNDSPAITIMMPDED